MDVNELLEALTYMVPVYIAFLLGLMIGWAWMPKWVNSKGLKLTSSVSKTIIDSSSLLPSPSGSPPVKESASSAQSWVTENKPSEAVNHSRLQLNEKDEQQSNLVSKEDLHYLWKLLDMKDGGPKWIQMMNRSTITMTYQAWRRDPETGPPQYHTRTVFEDATPEIVRDFFWDDEYRSNWDKMLTCSTTIKECQATGAMVVHSIRKFPFFCSDREYITARRIWESGRSYYCVTKGVPCDSIPRRDKPRRVDFYYSSWCVRQVESVRGTGERTACEVILFHQEDMLIPREIAKIGIKQGMWGAVKKIEPGLRIYQKERANGAPLSRPAFMAHISTKITPEYLSILQGNEDSSKTEVAGAEPEKLLSKNTPKLLIVAGTILLACTIDKAFFPKAIIFGLGRKFTNKGKKV